MKLDWFVNFEFLIGLFYYDSNKTKSLLARWTIHAWSIFFLFLFFFYFQFFTSSSWLYHTIQYCAVELMCKNFLHKKCTMICIVIFIYIIMKHHQTRVSQTLKLVKPIIGTNILDHPSDIQNIECFVWSPQ